MDEQQHFALMASVMLNNEVVPFLGAGVNMCGRGKEPYVEGRNLPNGDELATYLAAKFYLAGGRDRERLADFPRMRSCWWAMARSTSGCATCSTMTTCQPKSIASSRACRSTPGIWAATFQLILTVNYDDAVERAFAQAGEPVDVLVYMEKGERAGRFVHFSPDGKVKTISRPNTYELRLDERPAIVKIHGAIDRGQTSKRQLRHHRGRLHRLCHPGGRRSCQSLPCGRPEHGQKQPLSLPRVQPAQLESACGSQPHRGRTRRHVRVMVRPTGRHRPRVQGVEEPRRRCARMPLEDYVTRLRDALEREASQHAAVGPRDLVSGAADAAR